VGPVVDAQLGRRGRRCRTPGGSTPGTVQMAATRFTPVADSISGMSAHPVGRARDKASRYPGSSVLGTITAVTVPGWRAAIATSSACHGVSLALIRTTARFPSASQARTCSRAPGLPSDATASSRSRMTASAPDAAALENRSGRSPGYEQERPGGGHVRGHRSARPRPAESWRATSMIMSSCPPT
jgi:hypothetical protein